MTRLSPLALVLLVPALAAEAQPPTLDLGEDWKVALAAQVRVRGIADSGRDLLPGSLVEREYVTQRVRLGADLLHAGGARIAIRLQDVRVWGEELDTLGDASAAGFDLYEGYARIPVGAVDVSIGRQAISLLNERLVGAVGWTQRGRSFDAVRATFTGAALELGAFYALVSEKDSDPDGAVPPDRLGDVGLAGVHGTLTWETHAGSVLVLSKSDVPSREYRHTAGLLVDGRAGGFSYTAELYGQLGRFAGDPVAAFLLAGRGGWTADHPLAPGITLFVEALSGDGTRAGTFDTLYATNHKFYGEMDFFLAIPAHTANRGLLDVGGRVAARPAESLAVHLDVHRLATMAAGAAGTRALGTELDLAARWTVRPGLTLRAVYGILVPQDAFGEVRGLSPGVDPEVEHLAFVTVDLTHP